MRCGENRKVDYILTKKIEKHIDHSPVGMKWFHYQKRKVS